MTTRRGRVWLPVRANPAEAFLLALCGWTGMSGLLGHAEIAEPLRRPSVDTAWYALLAVGGAVGLGALLKPGNGVTSLLVLRAACWWIATGAAIFTVVLVSRGRWDSAVVVGTFAAAKAWRIVQITAQLRAAL